MKRHLSIWIGTLCVLWVLVVGFLTLGSFSVAAFDRVERRSSVQAPVSWPVVEIAAYPVREGPGNLSLADLAAGAAHLCGVPRKLFFALIARESSWNVDAVSSAGALGLAQILPSTLKDVSPTLDPSRPFDRLVGGACYLRMQFDRTGSWELALHAYNAGPNRKTTPASTYQYAADILMGAN